MQSERLNKSSKIKVRLFYYSFKVVNEIDWMLKGIRGVP